MLNIEQVQMSETPIDVEELKIANDISSWAVVWPYILITLAIVVLAMLIGTPLHHGFWRVDNLITSSLSALILGCGFWALSQSGLRNRMQSYIRLGYSEAQLVERYGIGDVSLLVWAYKHK